MKDIWDSLEKIHHSGSFSTCLSLQRHFLSMMKDPYKPMSHWIAAMKQVAYRLTEISAMATDEDIIVMLTLSLPTSYESFTITLDSTPFDQLTLDYVIT